MTSRNFRVAIKATSLASVALVALGASTIACAQAGPAPSPDEVVKTPQGAAAINNARQGQTPAIDNASDIIVTARREAENVQNVPVSVQVVTGDTIQKLAITQSTEISKLAPGLNVTAPTGNVNDQEIVLRGVRWTSASGTPAIPTYFNEIPFLPAFVLTGLFDLGQVEVLRGPQGTTRGAPSISGALTFTTHRADLHRTGGYVSGLVGSHDHQNLQGALNLPIIDGKLALRLAGFLDNNEGSRVRSLFNPRKPFVHERIGRATVQFDPTDNLSITGMLQYQSAKGIFYQQVAGNGSPGRVGYPAAGIPNIPAQFNTGGRSIAPGDFLAVQEAPSILDVRRTTIALNAAWDIQGQRLSYNFGLAAAPQTGQIAIDLVNNFPGFDILPTGNYPGGKYRYHELRLSSIRHPGRLFDYDVGFYRETSGSKNAPINFSTPVYLPGAFGPFLFSAPGQVSTPFSRYTLTTSGSFTLLTKNYSLYANVQVHLPADTELSAGIRYINDKRPVTEQLNIGSSFANVGPLALYSPIPTCGLVGAYVPQFGGATTVNSTIYPGFCDVVVPAQSQSRTANSKAQKPIIYNVSLSHKFTPEILAYATVGSSFRQGLPAIFSLGLPDALLVPAPEKARSYEVGLKTSAGHWLRANVDVFQIDYKGQLAQFPGINYRGAGGQTQQTTITFYRNLDSRVRGIEAEVNLRPARGLTLNASASYTKITGKGGNIPCNDPTRPLTTSNPINFCPTANGQTVNPTAPFQANLNGSYSVPLGGADAYVRFNINHQGPNPAFGVSDPAFTAKSYQIVDVYAGVTGNHGGWDLGVYGKNVFNKKELLQTTGLNATTIFNVPGFTPLASGLSSVAVTPAREIGLQLRYAFGSR